jgi:hypothetical protein
VIQSTLVFETLAHSSLGFWITALLIVVVDSALLLDPGRLTFAIRRRLNVEVRVIEYPLLLRGKEPVVTLFAYPFAPFFISSIEVPSQDRSTVKRLLLRNKRLAGHCGHLSVLAFISLLMVCVVGPLISLQYGIERALVTTLPMLYLTALGGVMIVYANRSLYGLGRSELVHVSVELLFCPYLLVNILKKIAISQKLTLCTSDLMDHFANDRPEVAKRLSAYIEATKP